MSILIRFLLIGCMVHGLFFEASGGTTMATFSETYFDSGETFTDEVSDSPLFSAGINSGGLEESNPDYNGPSAYDVFAEYDASDFTVLRTTAGAFVSASVDDPDPNDPNPQVWKTIQMNATAVSTLTAFGIVQNAGGTTSGTVELAWIVDGWSRSKLDDVRDATVEMSSVTTLSQTTFDGANVFTASADSSEGDDIAKFSNFETNRITLDWGQDPQNPEVPVFFQLTSKLTLTAINDTNENGKFFANASAEFGSSAVLDLSQTKVFDASGTPIPGATFTVSAVPEPSAASLLALVASLFGYKQWSRARANAHAT